MRVLAKPTRAFLIKNSHEEQVSHRGAKSHCRNSQNVFDVVKDEDGPGEPVEQTFRSRLKSS